MASSLDKDRKSMLDVLVVRNYLVYGIHKEEGFSVTKKMIESNKFKQFYKGDFLYLKNKLDDSNNKVNSAFVRALDHELNDSFFLYSYYKNFLIEIAENEVNNNNKKNFLCYGLSLTIDSCLGSMFKKLNNPKFIHIIFKERS